MPGTPPGTLGRLQRLFQDNNRPLATLALDNGYHIAVPGQMGHVLGPFAPDDSESVLWLNPEVWKKDGAELVAGREWNIGGERMWTAPELTFNIADRERFWETYTVPAALDPGEWKITATGTAIELSIETALQRYRPDHGDKRVRIKRRVTPAKNPLHSLASAEALRENVTYAGYEHLVEYEERSVDGVYSEPWIIAQVWGGGEVLMPATPGLEKVPLIERVPSDHWSYEQGTYRLRLPGNRKYKIGLRSPGHFGRLGYQRILGDSAELIVRQFFSNPSSLYVEEPNDYEGTCRGISLAFYSDDGALGGFGELECNGQTIGGDTGRSATRDAFLLWAFRGDVEAINSVAGLLLGTR